MSNDIYSISDLDGYANSVRDSVAASFAENYTENLDDFITLEQVKNIVINYSLGQDENGLYLIDEEAFNCAFDDIREWFYETGLAKLAAKGVVECAWDDDLDQMVFWIPTYDSTNYTTNNKSSTGDR